MRLNLSKSIDQAKVFFTTDVKKTKFKAQVSHSSCSHALRFKKSWEISKAHLTSRVFGRFIDHRLSHSSEKIHLHQRTSKDSYLYISYVLRDPLDNRIVAYDYGYIQILRPPPVANLTGVTTAIKGQGSVILNGSAAIQSKRNKARLTYRWYCRREGERFPDDDSHLVDVPNGNSNTSSGCYGFGPGRLSGNKRYLRVDVDNMAAGQTYVFRVVVELHSKASTDDHYLTVMVPTNFTVR